LAKKRKSPYRHKVRTYRRRDGTVVHTYMRGKGPKPRRGQRPRRRAITAPEQPFFIRLQYPDGVEELTVQSSTYLSALDRGITSRRQPDAPHTIVIRRRS